VTETESEARRSRSLNTTSRDMLLSMAVIVAIGVALLLLVPRPNQIPVRSLDVPAAAAASKAELGFAPADPKLPDGWTARSADVQRATDDLPTWHLTYTTPSGHYAGVQQTAKATAAWEANQVTGGNPAQGTRTLGSQLWIIRSRLDRGITSLVLRQPDQSPPITTVVTGTATQAEIDQLALAVAP
jgi:hypothetical protein